MCTLVPLSCACNFVYGWCTHKDMTSTQFRQILMCSCGPCLFMGAMALVPVSARNCEVMSTLHDARVGGSGTPAYKDMTLV